MWLDDCPPDCNINKKEEKMKLGERILRGNICVSKEDLLDECALAFNRALDTAKKDYPWRYPRIQQAYQQIRQLIEKPKPRISEKFIERWCQRLRSIKPVFVDKTGKTKFYNSYAALEEMLQEANVEIVEIIK